MSKLNVLLKAKQLKNTSSSITINNNLNSNKNKENSDFDDNFEYLIKNDNYFGTNINPVKTNDSLDLNNFINNLKDNPDIDLDNLLPNNEEIEEIINSNTNESDIELIYNTDSSNIKNEFDINKLQVKYFYNQDSTQGLNIYSGPYDYKLCFEDKAYPHSVNLNKLIFNYRINDNYFSKILYLSTGHSFAETTYITDLNNKIFKTNQIEQIFNETNKNLFYSLDNGFDDFALIDFGELSLNNSNKLKFDNKLLNINSICKNMDIKFLENETFIKNGNNIGETWAKTIINFQTDNYIKSVNDPYTFYTFKINGKIVIVQTKYSSGIVLKGINSRISKYNSEPVSEDKNNEQLEFYFSNILKEFSSHEIFSGTLIDDKVYSNYFRYRDTNSLSIVSLMGDSGSGFYRIIDNQNIEFVGINIGSCSLMVLSQSDKKYPNKLMWNNTVNKLVFGGYVIEEIHKSCQMLPVDQIENLIKRNLPHNINIKEITV